MEAFTLILGNKNYSSWSMRAWLAARATGAPFQERVYFLGDPASRAEIRRYSPTGKVPALVHGGLVVWDSLAVSEYLAELFPRAGLWPEAREAYRALIVAAGPEARSATQNLALMDRLDEGGTLQITPGSAAVAELAAALAAQGRQAEAAALKR